MISYELISIYSLPVLYANIELRIFMCVLMISCKETIAVPLQFPSKTLGFCELE